MGQESIVSRDTLVECFDASPRSGGHVLGRSITQEKIYQSMESFGRRAERGKSRRSVRVEL